MQGSGLAGLEIIPARNDCPRRGQHSRKMISWVYRAGRQIGKDADSILSIVCVCRQKQADKDESCDGDAG